MTTTTLDPTRREPVRATAGTPVRVARPSGERVAQAVALLGSLSAAVLLTYTVVALPNRLLQVIPPDAQLPARHPAAGKGMVGGKPAAYVCKGQTCGLPVTHPKALATALALG